MGGTVIRHGKGSGTRKQAIEGTGQIDVSLD